VSAGRPSDYDPAFCEQVVEFGKEGLLPISMAARLGVTKSTIHLWAKVHPEFSDAFDLARAFCEAYHMERACETAHGSRSGNAPMTKFILSAAFGYRETSGVELSGEVKQSTPLSPEDALKAAKVAEEAGEV
jgi:hypothetical protein